MIFGANGICSEFLDLKNVEGIETIFVHLVGFQCFTDGNTFPDLKTITVSSSKMKNLNFLSASINLTSASIKGQLNDITGLKNCTKVESLDLSDNSISSLEGIENLNLLSTLNLKNNNLYNTYNVNGDEVYVADTLSRLNTSGALKSLYLNGNVGLTNFKNLSSLTWTVFDHD